MVESSQIITLGKESLMIQDTCCRIRQSKRTMLWVLAASKDLPASMVPLPKPHPGKIMKTSAKTDALIKCVVKQNPFITSTEMTKMYPELLKNLVACILWEYHQHHPNFPLARQPSNAY